MFNRFRSTLSLVSRFPIKRGKEHFDLSRADFYLPITGVFPALGGMAVLGAGSLFTGSPVLAVILALIAQYLAFNLFHLDGLMDTADAFLGSFDREKRFAVLKDSRIGVYGFFAGVAVLSLKAGLLYALFPYLVYFPAPLLAYPISGRFSAALIPGLTTPAKPGGLGAMVKESRPLRAFLGLLMSLVLWMALVWGISALFILEDHRYALSGILLGVSVGASPLVSVFLARLYRKHLGGYTGDALGAAVELAEILHLTMALVILARIG
ncbi:MAG: adenosylcobinamide-GDP ribazoletransferase [Spirochaetaceae bacterium]|jgi:adenosylcobinamide-GDP ribazoletransferase|nr:adenosylcobinamide-GDP ribazoletransferase [Spirochaetaceae bacterium]